MKGLGMKVSKGEQESVALEKIEMEDPNFPSGSVHTAHVTFTNPKSASFSYTAELYLGKSIGNKQASSGVGSFTIPGGQSLSVDFTVSMPTLTIEQDSYHVYLTVAHAGTTLITYVSTEDVIVSVEPAITHGPITWD